MRKKRAPDTEAQRTNRRENEARRRNEDSAAEDKTMDALVKRSIETYGP